MLRSRKYVIKVLTKQDACNWLMLCPYGSAVQLHSYNRRVDLRRRHRKITDRDQTFGLFFTAPLDDRCAYFSPNGWVKHRRFCMHSHINFTPDKRDQMLFHHQLLEFLFMRVQL